MNNKEREEAAVYVVRNTLTFRSLRDDFNKLILRTIPLIFLAMLLRRILFSCKEPCFVSFPFFSSFSLSPACPPFHKGCLGGGGGRVEVGYKV